MRGVPLFNAGDATPDQRSAELNAAGDHVTEINPGGDVAPLDCTEVGQTNPAAADALVIGAPLRPLMPEPDTGSTQRPPVGREIPAATVIPQPVT